MFVAVVAAELFAEQASSSSGNADVAAVTAVVSVGIAAVALLVSMSNRRTARRALVLAERQEARRLAPFGLYLNEARRWRLQPGGATLGAHVRVSNPADRGVSVVRAELHVQYTSPENVILTVKVPCVSDVGPADDSVPVEPAEMPLSVGPTSARAGWFLFRVDAAITNSAPVDRYDIVLEDVEGRSESVQIVTFSEVLR